MYTSCMLHILVNSPQKTKNWIASNILKSLVRLTRKVLMFSKIKKKGYFIKARKKFPIEIFKCFNKENFNLETLTLEFFEECFTEEPDFMVFSLFCCSKLKSLRLENCYDKKPGRYYSRFLDVDRDPSSGPLAMFVSRIDFV